MSRAVVEPRRAPEPVPGGIVALLAYLGGLVLLSAGAIRAAWPRRGSTARLGPTLARPITMLLGPGLVLVILVHLSMGSFLAMQAFFGATFRDAAGAVVGVGLTRNLAPLLTGFIVSGLLAARVVPELRDGLSAARDDAGRLGPNRIAAAHLLAAMVAGPVLVVWGAASGLLSGMLVARSVLGVEPGLFLSCFVAMIRPVDALGLVVKGAGFAAVGALMACHEGLRGRGEVAPSALRSACLSTAAILFFNSVWFSLVYLAGKPFGPALVGE